MKSLLINRSDRDTLIFHIWKSLKYNQRISLSLILIVFGIILQVIQLYIFPGIFFILIGNLLLLTKGFDNRLSKAIYNAGLKWNKASADQVNHIIEINKKIRKWDLSIVDISNGLGIITFIVIGIIAFIIFGMYQYYFSYGLLILLTDILILLTPHWFTGIKKITTTPKLVAKTKLFKQLVHNQYQLLQNHTLEYNVLLQGDKEKLPKDLKIRVAINNQPDNFLGVYGQMNMNVIEGKSYPYFYVVLVAKKTFNLIDKKDKIKTNPGIIVETQQSTDVDVIIIRQYTTKTSGYHTKPATMNFILKLGIESAISIIK